LKNPFDDRADNGARLPQTRARNPRPMETTNNPAWLH
jgi:hypothetical protein